MKKGALQISFGWLFAIIVGIFIIALAIFGVTKLIGTEQTSLDAQSSEEINVLLNPLETSFESAKTTSFTMAAESRIYIECNTLGNFGEQSISVSQKSFNKWTETNVESSLSNKYIFSEEFVEGQTFYIFSKPFEFPFKVSDLIYLTSSEDVYCFVNAPSDIEDEIETLGQENLLTENCSDETINICFSGDCDINVDYDSGSGYVEKEGEYLYFYSDALMYGAIFSDAENYNCLVKRLMQRTEMLLEIYESKVLIIGDVGCETEVILGLLGGLETSAGEFNESRDILSMEAQVDALEEYDDEAGSCKLW